MFFPKSGENSNQTYTTYSQLLPATAVFTAAVVVAVVAPSAEIATMQADRRRNCMVLFWWQFLVVLEGT